MRQIAIVEDNTNYLTSIKTAINGNSDMQVVWTATCLDEARHHLNQLLADAIILDLGLPDGSGLNLIPEILAIQPNCLIMVNSAFADEHRIFSALQAGALGYLLKDCQNNDLSDEVRLLLNGGSPINPLVARKLLQRTQALPIAHGQPAPQQTTTEKFHLSEREVTTLQWLCRGYSSTETADIMDVSPNTLRTYVRRIYKKLHVSSRSAAIAVAHNTGLFEPR